MNLSKDLLSNKIFEAQELVFDYIPMIHPPKGVVDRSAILQPNGDYIIRIGAPAAKEMMVLPWFGDPTPEGYAPWRDKPIYGVKNEDGVFECVLPFDQRKTGPRNIEIYIDGTYVLWPYLPIFWSGSHPYNYVEVPDPELEFCYIKDVPHGLVSSDLYWSNETKNWERCVVYTPPGYMNSTVSYPVLYLQHGGTENETVWTSTGRVNYILDNLIAAGECVPFIIVMNNGMIRYEYGKAPNYLDECFERSLIYSCIPHLEKNYRIKTGKWNRAIAGLSMGSMQTNDIGFKHPEVFGNMASFTSTMYHEDFHTTYERPWPKVMANPEQFMKDYKVFYCSATPQEDHIPFFMKDAEIMREAGIEGKMSGYRRVLHDGRFIRWDSWRMGMREFATMLFRD